MTPIVSTDGAIAAVLAVLTGEVLGGASAVLLVVIVVGVVLAGAAPHASTPDQAGSGTFWLAVGAALLFGLVLFVTGRLSASFPPAWSLLPPRVVGVAALTIPLALTRRLSLTRPAVPLVFAAGLAEVLGFVCYAIGARHSIAIAAVLGSQFAVVASVAAYVRFRERLTRLQLGGVVAIIVGAAALTVVTLT